MKDPVVYPKMGAIIKECIVSPNNMFHVLLEPAASLAAVLNSPVVSLIQILSLKDGVTSESFLGSVTGLAALLDLPGCYAKLVERDEYVIINGWDSVEVCCSATVHRNQAYLCLSP